MRDLFEPTPLTGSRNGVDENNHGNGDYHGTPKRQRVCGNDSEAGSQSTPPGVEASSSIGQSVFCKCCTCQYVFHRYAKAGMQRQITNNSDAIQCTNV
jgi:hypothetical protein